MPAIRQVIPLLVYEDLAAAHDFLVRAFGFEAGGVSLDAEGRAVHAEVRAGSTTIWLHRVTDEHQLQSPQSGVAGSGLVVLVDDVDAHCSQARAAGATIESEPRDMPYPQCEYAARDPEGHRWWFAAPLNTMTSPDTRTAQSKGALPAMAWANGTRQSRLIQPLTAFDTGDVAGSETAAANAREARRNVL